MLRPCFIFNCKASNVFRKQECVHTTLDQAIANYQISTSILSWTRCT